MNVLQYNHLDYTKVKDHYNQVVEMLKRDDFYSADVKKIANTPYYRAKLDKVNRLLFKVATYNNEKYALLLEVIYNHAYDKSRFLRGAPVIEENIVFPDSFGQAKLETYSYINRKNFSINVLDKIISFDDAQYEIFKLQPPLIIIGSAGSGKTVLTLEKLKECYGNILYVTHSPYLVENSRNLYYSHQYENEEQNVDFLCYREFIETIKIPVNKEINGKLFAKWLVTQNKGKLFNDSNKVYEEFKGVITGTAIDKKYLSYEEYLNLGIKQSIFSSEERAQVYDVFTKYLKFLAAENFYDSNLLSFDYVNLMQEKYDFIVVDEIQDFTNIQLYLILKTLKLKNQFILAGDSNQIVHPNFFSWAKIKTLFYHKAQQEQIDLDIMRILHKNYRNSPEVTAVANNILKTKNIRFGSLDKESNYLVDSHANNQGLVNCLVASDKALNELNNKTKKSTKFAVIVLYDELKDAARQYFETPLIFSIQEAKGLEYENVILYKFISSESQKYHEITKGVSSDDLKKDLVYSRVKDKSDRSMEIYKFYINALYVAITRAIKALYIVEDTTKHPLLDLLNLQSINDNINLKNTESSLEEWRQEARRLELQGKLEQAEAIKNNILSQKQVPWRVIDNAELQNLQNQAWDTTKIDKEVRLLLLEYAILYGQETLIKKLQNLNFKPAFNPEKARDILERKYFLFYNSPNITAVARDTEIYGINFKNIFNQTPLMVASLFCNVTLVRYLIENGAEVNLIDNAGRIALQVLLMRAYFSKSISSKLVDIYKLLTPSSISIKVEDKLLKIDQHLMEYFLFNLIFAISPQKFAEQYFCYRPGFCTHDFLKVMGNFPNSILLERRKKRSYISSILSKNETARNDKYNRQLFLRTQHGRYILNPKLEIKIGENWSPVYDLLGIDLVTILNKANNDK